jgi:hypothetical protein
MNHDETKRAMKVYDELLPAGLLRIKTGRPPGDHSPFMKILDTLAK